jgi:hypothetical protein
MPTIKITDRLGASLDATPAPGSIWLRYARALPDMILGGEDISHLQLLTLADPAVRSLAPALAFNQPVELGTGGPQLTVRADAGASFRVVSRTADRTVLFSPDEYGDNIEVPAGSCYVALALKADAGAALAGAAGALRFGLDAQGGMAIESFRPFSDGANAPTIAEALLESVGGFVLPAAPEDFAALPAGAIVTVTGSDTLSFSGTVNLLAVANPLASVALASPLPAVALKQGASVEVGASWKISSDFQVRIHKLDARRVRLGWHRKSASDPEITATAEAGVSGGAGDSDLFPRLIAAVSSNAKADLEELRRAGLPEERKRAMADAVAGAVNRKLELSLAAQLGALGSDDAMFLYELDLSAMDARANKAVGAALRGDLTGLADLTALPAGVTGIRSVFSREMALRASLKINLLGIFNYGSVARLALNGTVTFTPSTGDLAILDEASASRVRTSTVNFGADEEKLRQLMAESFLITAAYRGSRAVMAPPDLASSHMFFRLDNHTSADEMRRAVAAVAALGLAPPTLPLGVGDFGRSTFLAEARYDDALSHALFLRPDGSPREVSEFEAAGRQAIRLLVPADGDDAFRLRPATDDALWARMKDAGPANFHLLLPPNEAEGVRPDYLAICWWADSMRSAGETLSAMRGLSAGPESAGFGKLRDELGRRLRDVAAKAHEQFGTPWGLVAMFLVGGGAAVTAAHITGPRLVFAAEKALGPPRDT